jgi:hypothetical protein
LIGRQGRLITIDEPNLTGSVNLNCFHRAAWLKISAELVGIRGVRRQRRPANANLAWPGSNYTPALQDCQSEPSGGKDDANVSEVASIRHKAQSQSSIRRLVGKTEAGPLHSNYNDEPHKTNGAANCAGGRMING